jgi:integrase
MRRIFGPYEHRKGKLWKIIIQDGIGRDAHKTPFYFKSQTEAQAAADEHRKTAGAETIGQAIEGFLAWQAAEGKAASSITTARYRLEGFFELVMLIEVKEIGGARAQKLYEMYQVGRAPDTHQGALATVKAMFEWLRKKKKSVKWNVFEDVDPSGRKNHGKVQLKKDHTRKLYRWLVANAVEEDRACGALLALALGLRAHEVVGRTKDHLDSDGTELMVTKSKTRAGIRSVRLPPVLQQALARRAELRSGRLLPYKAPWVRDAVKWACTQAGVPVVCAQALRGMYATATLESGLDPAAVAKSLGHTNVGITRKSYAAAGSEGSVKSEAVIQVLEGAAVKEKGPGSVFKRRPFAN